MVKTQAGGYSWSPNLSKAIWVSYSLGILSTRIPRSMQSTAEIISHPKPPDPNLRDIR